MTNIRSVQLSNPLINNLSTEFDLSNLVAEVIGYPAYAGNLIKTDTECVANALTHASSHVQTETLKIYVLSISVSKLLREIHSRSQRRRNKSFSTCNVTFVSNTFGSSQKQPVKSSNVEVKEQQIIAEKTMFIL